MSLFNRKGYKTLLGRTKTGELKAFPVKADSAIAIKHDQQIAKIKKERQKAFRAYKAQLREAKKKVPLAERAKMNWSRVPERYL